MHKDITPACLAAITLISLVLVIGHHIPVWVGAWYILCGILPVIID